MPCGAARRTILASIGVLKSSPRIGARQAPYADVASIKILHEDPCGNGVVFDIASSKLPEQGLFVDKETNTLSYAPAARCPGRHLQIWEFLKSHFG